MKAIGGYFELELNPIKQEYHANAIPLNTARNALEYFLRANKCQKLYLPYFTCDVLMEPVNKLEIPYEFYHIDTQFEPVFNYGKLMPGELFLYTNYFGLKDEFIKSLTETNSNFIIDNSQAFYSKPIEKTPAFYSPRKFFGVPDGAYLYTDMVLETPLETDLSYDRFAHLLIRADASAEQGYPDFAQNDKKLDGQQIKKMSTLTHLLLQTIDYDDAAQIRKQNFALLHEQLSKTNRLHFVPETIHVPMVYPYWTYDKDLRKRLQENRIYTAQYWPNVLQWCDKQMLEYKMAEEIVYLPIDQRYSIADMQRIIHTINT